MERKWMRLKVSSLGEDGTIEGHGSIANNVDLGGDVVKGGAFKRTLDAVKASGKRIKMLWQHDTAKPIGVWEEVREDGKGLYVKGRLVLEVQQAREAYALLKAGAIEGLSIGYDVIQDKVEKNVRYLLELKLWEVSIVTFPMNERAGVESVKALAAKGNKFASSFEEQNEGAQLSSARYVMFDVLNSVVFQILYDDTLDVTGKQAALDESLNQFSAAMLAWMGDAATEQMNDAEGKAAASGAETKEGRMLSAKNLARVKAIHDHAKALLQACGSDDSGKAAHSPTEPPTPGPATEDPDATVAAEPDPNDDATTEQALDAILADARAIAGRS